jgi:hypothetical protein
MEIIMEKEPRNTTEILSRGREGERIEETKYLGVAT